MLRGVVKAMRRRNALHGLIPGIVTSPCHATLGGSTIGTLISHAYKP